MTGQLPCQGTRAGPEFWANLTSWLEQGKTVAASLAPSYRHIPGVEPGRVVGALRSLGFSIVEETLVALPDLAARRLRLVEEHPEASFITSSCPEVVRLVKTEFPHLASALEPSPSPMMLHARWMKERYGKDTMIVFVGPCPAKRVQASESPGYVDAVLTFVEMEKICMDRGFRMARAEDSPPDRQAQRWALKALYHVEVSGMDACRRFLRGFPGCQPGGRVVEVLACEGGCLHGPGMPGHDRTRQDLTLDALGLEPGEGGEPRP